MKSFAVMLALAAMLGVGLIALDGGEPVHEPILHHRIGAYWNIIIGYTIGSLQMQRLLADRKRQLGEDFDLKAFHDSLMTSGRLPLSLLRWEMTGLDDEVRQFWKREPIPD